MSNDKEAHAHSGLAKWWHDTFDDMFFRSVIGPAQTRNAVQGCDEEAREQWKHDLEHRKAYTREQRERRRREHEAQQN